MGAKRLHKLTDHRDNIEFTGVRVSEQPGGGLAKISSVKVHANHNRKGKDLWIGLRISKRQKIRYLKVANKVWIGQRQSQDSDAVKQIKSVFRPKLREKWVAYRVSEADIPRGPTFQTELKLDRHVAKYPDAQSVLIGVCYIPEPGTALNLADVLVGHSMVPAPRRKRSKKGKRKLRR